MGGVRGKGGVGQLSPVPLPLVAPKKNFDGDIVPSGKHTHAN